MGPVKRRREEERLAKEKKDAEDKAALDKKTAGQETLTPEE